MKNTLILSMLFLFFLPYSHGQSKEKDTTALQLYFPVGVLCKDTTRVCPNLQYSINLFSMKEPVLYTDSSHNEIYRFLWLRTFAHPVTVRIEKQVNKYMLYWKMFDGKELSGSLIADQQKEIDEVTWNKFHKLLIKTDFWNMEPTQHINSLCFDGSNWILEGKNGAQYHVVDRWSPSQSSKYYQCCYFLIKLTDYQQIDRNNSWLPITPKTH